MDLFRTALNEGIRANLTGSHVYDEEWLDSNKTPAIILSDFNETVVDRNTMTRGRYITEVAFRATLRHKENVNDLNRTKYENRHDLFNDLKVLLLEQPNNNRLEFLDHIASKSNFLGSSRETNEGNGFFNIIHHLDVSYTMFEDWERSLDVNEIFSNIASIDTHIDNL